MLKYIAIFLSLWLIPTIFLLYFLGFVPIVDGLVIKKYVAKINSTHIEEELHFLVLPFSKFRMLYRYWGYKVGRVLIPEKVECEYIEYVKFYNKKVWLSEENEIIRKDIKEHAFRNEIGCYKRYFPPGTHVLRIVYKTNISRRNKFELLGRRHPEGLSALFLRFSLPCNFPCSFPSLHPLPHLEGLWKGA